MRPMLVRKQLPSHLESTDLAVCAQTLVEGVEVTTGSAGQNSFCGVWLGTLYWEGGVFTA